MLFKMKWLKYICRIKMLNKMQIHVLCMFGRFGNAFVEFRDCMLLNQQCHEQKAFAMWRVTRLHISSGESTKILENYSFFFFSIKNTQANKCTDLVLHVRTNIMPSDHADEIRDIRTLNIVRSNLERLIRTLPKKLFFKYKFIFHLSLCDGPLFCAQSNFESFHLYFSFVFLLCLHIIHLFIVHLIHLTD